MPQEARIHAAVEQFTKYVGSSKSHVTSPTSRYMAARTFSHDILMKTKDIG